MPAGARGRTARTESCRTKKNRAWTGPVFTAENLLLLNRVQEEFNATVHGTSFGGAIVRYRMAWAASLDRQVAGWYALAAQIAGNRLGAINRQCLVDRRRSGAVGVADRFGP